jgi:protein-S-isoprenylcysteine O-methyltransferase Ste14
MDLFDRILNAIFSVALMLILGGIAVYLIPRWIIDSDFHLFPLEIGVFRFTGLGPIILGIVTMTGFIWGWILSGTGTPLQFDTPKELIVRGSYRFVRNPMYVRYCLILFGEILLFKSSALLLYLLVSFLFFHTIVVFVEEPMLKLKFGESYEQYCKSVRRWIPRLKPFRGDISKSS